MKTIYEDVDKWDTQFNEKSDEERYGFVIETLKQPLSKSFIDELDLGMILVDLKDNLEDERQFDKLFKLIEILQTYQPELYQVEYPYFDEFLIEYYLFHNDKEKLKKALLRFEENPVQGVDILLPLHKKLLLYGHTDLAIELSKKMYKPLDTSPELIGGTGLKVAIPILYSFLEQQYEEFLKTNNFNWDEFAKEIIEFDFKSNNEFINLFKKGLTGETDNKETLYQQFFNNRKDYMYILDCYFLKYMRQNKQMSFTIGSIIWEGLWNFWEEQSGEGKHNPDKYFSLNKEKFDKYLVNLIGGFFAGYKVEVVAVLWGAIYVYDFLLLVELISSKVYNDALKIIFSLKAEVIKEFGNSLWEFNFVHRWKAPDAISQEEFNAENQIFVKSLNTKSESEIIDDLFDNLEKELNLKIEGPKTEAPKQVEKSKIPEPKYPKVGRNDSCPCGSGLKFKKCCLKKYEQ